MRRNTRGTPAPVPGLPADLMGCRSLTYRVRNGGWVTTSEWPYLFDHEGDAVTFTVPRGFVCDLASIPLPLTLLCPRERLGVSGPVFHDAVYRGVVGRTPPVCLTRRRTDQLFHTFMLYDRVPAWKARIAWAAVRVCGWAAWRRLPSREWALHLAD